MGVFSDHNGTILEMGNRYLENLYIWKIGKIHLNNSRVRRNHIENEKIV